LDNSLFDTRELAGKAWLISSLLDETPPYAFAFIPYTKENYINYIFSLARTSCEVRADLIEYITQE